MGHSTRRLMMGAAGAGGDPTYVEDVFSTYLYTGTSADQGINNGIKLSNSNAGNSVEFNSSSSEALITSHSNDFDFGSGDFTVEAWIKPTNASQVDPVVVSLWNFPDGRRSWAIFGDTGGGSANYTGTIRGVVSPDGQWATRTEISGTCTVNSWNHVAFIRNGNTLNFFVNGVSQGTASYTGSVYNNTSDGVMIGAMGDSAGGNNYFNGNISNVRVVKGTALYTSNFTPPTKALTSVTNTKLLCCQSSSSITATTVNTSGGMTALGFPTVSYGPFTATDGEGGFVWLKARNQGYDHFLIDTVRGSDKLLRPNLTNAEFTDNTYFKSFNNNGFTVGNNGSTNYTGVDFTSWTFRKTPGFCDVVSYTGNASAWNSGSQVLNHSLGCVPGLIIIKSRNQGAGPPDRQFYVYHKDIPNRPLFLDVNAAAGTGQGAPNYDPRYFNDPVNNPPTASTFQVGDNVSGGGHYGGPPGYGANENGQEYIAYLFAGGSSTAATARSVHFNSNYINTTTSSSDFTMGTGDFTIECWVNRDDQGQCGIFQISDTSGGLKTANYGNTLALASVGNVAPGRWQIYGAGSYAEATPGHAQKQWVHVAYARHNGVSKFYQDGIELISQSDTTNYDGTYIAIGAYYDTSLNYKGYISNFRVVKGTAVYTSSFTPPTEPLKNISGTVLLCLNDSSVTGATVTPQTLNSQGGPTASTNSPFDDPEGYKFGEGGDQNIVQCGQFKTDSGNGAVLNLPWEPQWILYKHWNANSSWVILDCMRGWTDYGLDNYLYPDIANAEVAMNGGEELKSRSIKFQGYGNNYEFMYMAIRRPDGLVGKPVEVGSDVFAVDPGNSSSIEAYTSGFPVDFSLVREIDNSSDWHQNSRLTQTYYLSTNTNGAQNGPYAPYSFDSNTGWLHGASAYNASWLSWMWKRHAGFDVVGYEGKTLNGGPRAAFAHNLNKIPEMIWVKRRDSTNPWSVYHKGLNGGSNPEGYGVQLNTNAAEASSSTRWGNTAPSSTHFFVGGNSGTNGVGSEHIAFLFASVDGISKCGYYTGNGSSITITTGFQPRFLVVKNVSGPQDWFVLDTTRGWGAGDDKHLSLNTDAAQGTWEFGAPTSTGFSFPSGNGGFNGNNEKYIYYAHA